MCVRESVCVCVCVREREREREREMGERVCVCVKRRGSVRVCATVLITTLFFSQVHSLFGAVSGAYLFVLFFYDTFVTA